MKILIAHNSYQWPGGEDFVVEQEAQLLSSHGHKVFRVEENNTRINELNQFELLSKTFWNQQTYNQVAHLIQQEGIDLLHVHNYFPLLSPSVFRAADTRGIPIVHTVHNYRLICVNGLLFRDNHPCHDCVKVGNFFPAVLHRCYRSDLGASAVAALSLSYHRLSASILGTVDRFIALGPFAVEQLRGGGVDERLITIKPNFLANDYHMGQGSGNFVTFAGRLSPEKGVLTLIAAWKLLRTAVPLKVAGDGPLAEQTREFAATIPLISWDGWLEQDALMRLLRDSRLLIIPSQVYEAGGSITVMQALASGTPVIVADTYSDADALLDAGVGWTFKSGDPADLAHVVELALSDQAKLLSMRERARNLFERVHSAQANYHQLMRIYEEAIDSRKSRSQNGSIAN